MSFQPKITFVLLLMQLLFISCQKEDGDQDLPSDTKLTLIANAGPDQSIILPQSYVLLNGSHSTVKNGKISNYIWSKISGPETFIIQHVSASQIQVSDLVEGSYQFELKVTAKGGIVSKDTVQVAVLNGKAQPVDPPVNYKNWTKLGYLPADGFFYDGGVWFNGFNFLMGVNNQLFAVSNKGGVWQLSASNTWSRKGDFPEPMGTRPVVFSINNKGYCLGITHNWQFDPERNTWQQKNKVPNYISDAYVALVIREKAYLVGSATGHVMVYDPATDSYLPKNNFPGTTASSGFVINGEGFCVAADGKCWKYEPGTDSWQQKAGLPPSITFNKGFSLNNYGYIIGDLNYGAYNHNLPIRVWRYDATLDKWLNFEEDYPGDGVNGISAVSMDNQVFVGLGFNNGDWSATDLWQFK